MATGARGRRFGTGLSARARALNSSVEFDQRLLEFDVEGSIAHARMLSSCGLISTEDLSAIESGLASVRDEIRAGTIELDPELEDIHMNVEARLIERIGEAGRRLHTARSRNDQVATDLRLYARAAADRISEELRGLVAELVRLAGENLDLVMPGYTHLQRAQPVRVSHHLLAYAEMFWRDHGRVRDARKRMNECPLGAAALAGTPHPIDREHTARTLGFDGPTRNSLDSVSDRDFAIELVSALALCQIHLTRLGEELVLWLSQEFSFASLSEAHCSASSIMPQKVNPDIAELVRGKGGRLVGAWVNLVTITKGLPLAYNKDFQETQEPLYDAVEQSQASIAVTSEMLASLEFAPTVLRQAVEGGYLVATEVADYLAAKGMPFRSAHDVAGALVRLAIEKGCELSSLSLAEFQKESELFGEDIFEALQVETAVDRRDHVGGTARSQVESEIKRWRELLA